MTQVWTKPSAVQEASEASYVTTRGLQALGQVLFSGPAGGVLQYGLMRISQRIRVIEQGSANFRMSLCFGVISTAIQELGSLFLEVTIAIVGERKQFENLQSHDQTSISHKLRYYSWKVVFVLESIPYQVDRLFSYTLDIRTARAIRNNRVSVRDLHFIEMVRQAVIAEIVETSLTFLTRQLAFHAMESLGYNVKALRLFIDGERKFSFALGLCLKVKELYSGRVEAQKESEYNQLVIAGKLAFGRIRNALRNTDDFEALLQNFYGGDGAAAAAILRAVVGVYGTGSLASEEILSFLSDALILEIRRLRNPNRSDFLLILESSVQNNTLFLEDCVREMMRIEEFAKVYVGDVSTDPNQNPLDAAIPPLLVERSKPALIYILAHHLCHHSSLTNIIPESTRTGIVNQFPDATLVHALQSLLEYAQTGKSNEENRKYIAILESALEEHTYRGSNDLVLGDFIRCVEATFPKANGSLNDLN